MSSAATANLIDFASRSTTSGHFRCESNHRLFCSLSREVYDYAVRFSRVPSVLDLGAGDGHATLEFLRLGCRVTAVDIVARELAKLRELCRDFESNLTTCVCDLEQESIGGEFDIISASSMLHHIPDYVGLIRKLIPLLKPHGQFFSFQDPMYSEQMPVTHKTFSRLAYASHRITQPDAFNGAWRYFRRLCGVYKADCVADNSEYHCVRNGVDEQAILNLFQTGRIVHYFATPFDTLQAIGEKVGIVNTFAIIARCS